MVNVVLDFDGTLTDADKEAVPYKEIHKQEFCRRTGVPVERVNTISAVLETTLKLDSLEGWVDNGKVVAPACADPYVLTSTVYRKIIDHLNKGLVKRYNLPQTEEERSKLLEELFRASYPHAAVVFRKGARRFLDDLMDEHNVVVVTNSDEQKVREKIGKLTKGDYEVPVVGDARKYKIDDSFGFVPESVRPDGFQRPVFLRRRNYFNVLTKLYKERSFGTTNTFVIGDIYELDLALPEHLGYGVILVNTPGASEHEKKHLESSRKGFVAHSFGEVLDILKSG